MNTMIYFVNASFRFSHLYLKLKYMVSKNKLVRKAKRSKGAAAQSQQIQTLSRQVEIVKDKLKDHSIPVYYKAGYSSNTDVYPLIVPLSSGPSSTAPAGSNNAPNDDLEWYPCFNTEYATSAVNKDKQNIKLYSQYVDVIVESGNEEDMLIHTVFLVSLNDLDGRARRTYNDTASMHTWTAGEDFISNSDRSGAQAYINPERYQIHKRWEFHTCGDVVTEPTAGAAGTIRNMSGAINRFGCKVNYSGRHIKVSGIGTDLDDLHYNDIAPGSKYWLVFFSDNSTLDLENPTVSVNSIIKARLF